MDGWISLHRKFLNWEWYNDINTSRLFLHCLLRANHKEVNWRGANIKRGDFITSLFNLSKETGLTTQKVRTSLNHLENTGELTRTSTNKLTKITVCKYDDYQDNKSATNKQDNKRITNEQQTNNKRLTTNNNDNKYNNVNNDNKKTLLSELKDSDVDNIEYLEITKAFYELFKSNLIELNVKTTTLEKAKGNWVDEIRKIINVDKWDKEDLIKVFQELKVNYFWKQQIQSTKNLRKHFKKILIIANGKDKQYNQKGGGYGDLVETLKGNFGDLPN